MAARSNSWSAEEDEALRQLVAQGVPQSEIGRRIGRSRGAVANRARALGVRSDRTVTVAATQAKVIDAKARRATLELQLLEDAEKLRAQLWQPHEYIDHGGKDYVRVTWTQDEPTPADKQRLMQAAVVAVDRSLKIATHDADTGVAEAVGALDQIADALAEVAKTLPDMGPDQ
ncbi:hypothetical protein GCM10027059_26660 [Myceligenerans halotolerans]